MKGHCVLGTIYLRDQGTQNIRTGTHRFGTSRHTTHLDHYGHVEPTIFYTTIELRLITQH